MVKSSLTLLIAILFLSGTDLQAQMSRYIVRLKDKAGTPYTLEKPEEFLSARAIERREKFNILINESDLPVSPAYVSQLGDTGAEVYFASKWMNSVLIQCPPALVAAIDALSFVETVELVAPGARLSKAEADGGRTRAKNSNARVLSDSEFQNGLIAIQHMHRQSLYGQGILIGVFDGGFAGVDVVPFFQHIHDNERLFETYDFVTNSPNVFAYDDHGTRVLSTIAARQMMIEDGDTTMFMGTAPDADFALFITEDVRSEYRIEEYNWLFAAERADSLGVDIIHTSVGYNTFNDSSMSYTKSQMDGKTAICTQAANLASERGIFIVASVGNEGSNSWKKVTAPADSPHVLAVGAIDATGKLANFSSAGPTADGRIKPDLVALGVFATVGTENGSVIAANGTSYSAPMLAGFVAGMMQVNPGKSPAELLEDILNSGHRADAPDTLFGYGIPDFLKATQGKILSVDDVINDKIKVYPNPFTENRLSIKINNELASNGLSVYMSDANGKMIAEREYNSYELNDVLIFEFRDVTPGVYFLRLTSETFEKQVKLLRY